MAIPSRQIGQSSEANLLWQMSKQLEYLIKVASQISGGGGGGTDKEFVVTVYTAKNAFTGASVGDIITCTQVIDVTTNTPVTVTTIWRNQTTATDLAGPPSFANLSLEGTTALTDAQLRASAVPVTVGNFPATQPVSGSVTANAGTNLNTSALALETGGNLASINNKIPTLGQKVAANSQPVVIASDQSDVPVSATALPLPNGASTEAKQDVGNTSLASIDSKLPALSNRVPLPEALALPTRVVGQDVETAGFGLSGASVLDDMFVQTPIVGTGITYNQTNGSLNILTGVTPNSEFLTRSVMTFNGAMKLRFSFQASQRIVNNNFQVSLADLIGEDLPINIVSSTLVDITLLNHGFTDVNEGQSMNIAGLTLGAIPGRYAIQSIPDADTIRFTVAGWPASGTGTCTLFGYNEIKNLITGTAATTILFDAQRNGWASGNTNAITNSTLGNGIIISNEITGRDVWLMDALRTSSTTPTFLTRASRYENIPEPTTSLYVFIWNYNGTVPPASSTTFTLASLSVEDFSNLPIYIQGFRANGQQNPIPVQLQTATANANIGNIGTVAAATLGGPNALSDVVSAAIITTANTVALVANTGVSYGVNIPVTAVTGTNPIMDVTIQESDDTGTNWFTVYSFPRIIATGIYRSPTLPLRGNRIRYVQTIGGGTPSFTRAINRLVMNISPINAISQLIDRSIVLTTLNSVTPTLNVQGGQNLQLVVNIGTASTPPQLQLEGSDDNGLTFYAIGTPLTAVASSTVQFTLATMINTQLVRARVSTVGAIVVAGYVLIKGF